MAKPIFVLNGPNLNRLGKREPEIYGTTTLAEIEAMCREAAGDRPIRFHQSNIEGADHRLDPRGDRRRRRHRHQPGRALSFTSIAILDALKMFPGPIVELHISNIHRREALYHHSYVSKVATAVIAGLGAARLCRRGPCDRRPACGGIEGAKDLEDLDRHRLDQRRSPREARGHRGGRLRRRRDLRERLSRLRRHARARSAAWSATTAWRSRCSSRSAISRACPSRSDRAPSTAPSASST